MNHLNESAMFRAYTLRTIGFQSEKNIDYSEMNYLNNFETFFAYVSDTISTSSERNMKENYRDLDRWRERQHDVHHAKAEREIKHRKTTGPSLQYKKKEEY